MMMLTETDHRAAWPVFFVGLALGLLGLQSESASAATLFVANNGVDSPTCGAVKDPCRSLSRAIQNAREGDRLVVGPGLYGDLDRNGTFTPATGEEAAEVGFGCGCMIKVDKRLTIESKAGAGATVLDAGGILVSVVRVQASSVGFGKPKKGFTLTRGSEGLFIDGAPSKVQAAGNLAVQNTADGFAFNGTGHVLTGNVAIANAGTGLQFVGTGHVLNGNLASGNNTGFNFHGGHDFRLTGNVASANGVGFGFAGTGHRLTGNVASANRVVGSSITGEGHVFMSNTVVGNQQFGVVLGANSDASTIRKNNFYGNAPSTNCGLIVDLSVGQVEATRNFWGAATGPGADPADAVCDFGIGSTTVVPFATKELPIRVRPLF